MKKFFMALMAVAAIAFVGCKPQNEPDQDKDNNQEQKDTVEVTCTGIKLYYTVEFAGKAADYVSLNVRYIEIPDSNKIASKDNITANWNYTEYSVEKGTTAYYGIEYAVKATELMKEALKDEAKYKTMLESGSKLYVSMCEKSTFSDGRSEENIAALYTEDFSKYPAFDASEADNLLAQLEKVSGFAHVFTWTQDNYIMSGSVNKFWSRH